MIAEAAAMRVSVRSDLAGIRPRHDCFVRPPESYPLAPPCNRDSVKPDRSQAISGGVSELPTVLEPARGSTFTNADQLRLAGDTPSGPPRWRSRDPHATRHNGKARTGNRMNMKRMREPQSSLRRGWRRRWRRRWWRDAEPRGRRNPRWNRNHVFDSNGPDIRVRGTAQQLFEKYLQLGPRRHQRRRPG